MKSTDNYVNSMYFLLIFFHRNKKQKQLFVLFSTFFIYAKTKKQILLFNNIECNEPFWF